MKGWAKLRIKSKRWLIANMKMFYVNIGFGEVVKDKKKIRKFRNIVNLD